MPTPELHGEDGLLKQLDEKYNGNNWPTVAGEVSCIFYKRPAHFSSDCNQSWARTCSSGICRRQWTNEQDIMLLRALKLQAQPLMWDQIASLIPGRTEAQVRCRA